MFGKSVVRNQKKKKEKKRGNRESKGKKSVVLITEHFNSKS